MRTIIIKILEKIFPYKPYSAADWNIYLGNRITNEVMSDGKILRSFSKNY